MILAPPRVGSAPESRTGPKAPEDTPAVISQTAAPISARLITLTKASTTAPSNWMPA